VTQPTYTLAAQAATATDPGFQAMVRVALVRTAMGVAMDPNSDAALLKLAANVESSLDSWVGRASWALAAMGINQETDDVTFMGAIQQALPAATVLHNS
jgi:hypothetical protein